MTTTSRRPPRATPKRQPSRRRRPADGTAAEPATPSRTDAKAPAPKTPAKAPAKAPAKTSGKTAAKAPAKTSKTSKTSKTPAKAPKAASKSTPKSTVPKTAVKAPAESGARRSGQPPRAPFILLIVALLAGALVSLLLLNTVLAKDAFTLTRLQQNTERLEEREQELKLQIAEGNSPERLAAMAKNLGMKENEVPVFFDVDNGTTSGGEVLRPVPHADAAAAGAASVIGIPGTIVPGDGAAR